MTRRTHAQVPLFVEVRPLSATAGVVSAARVPPAREWADGPGRYEPVDDEEAAAYGRALIARMRGEELTLEQRALFARAKAADPGDARAPSPVVDVSETLLALDRGRGGELRVALRRYKGSTPFLDIRRWERVGGDMRPTRQGVTIRAREVSRLLSVLVSAAGRLAQAGSAE